MATISSKTTYGIEAIPNILNNRDIETITPELLDTYNGRNTYFLFLTNHQNLSPLQKLYGLKPPANPDINSVKNMLNDY